MGGAAFMNHVSNSAIDVSLERTLQLVLLIGKVARLSETRTAQMLRPVGLSPSQLLVLEIIHAEGPQTPAALWRRMDHDAGAMCRLLRQLVIIGALERTADAARKRAFLVRLTGERERLRDAARRSVAR
jgi:DNA-binding MarR family transcriptional regulator